MKLHLLDFVLELNVEMKTQKTFTTISTALLMAFIFAQITISEG